MSTVSKLSLDSTKTDENNQPKQSKNLVDLPDDLLFKICQYLIKEYRKITFREYLMIYQIIGCCENSSNFRVVRDVLALALTCKKLKNDIFGFPLEICIGFHDQRFPRFIKFITESTKWCVRSFDFDCSSSSVSRNNVKALKKTQLYCSEIRIFSATNFSQVVTVLENLGSNFEIKILGIKLDHYSVMNLIDKFDSITSVTVADNGRYLNDDTWKSYLKLINLKELRIQDYWYQDVQFPRMAQLQHLIIGECEDTWTSGFTFDEFISCFASNPKLKSLNNEPYWPCLTNLTLWGYEGSFYKLMGLICKNAPNLISLNLDNSVIHDEFPDPPELSQVVHFPEKLQKLTAQIDVFHDYECEYHSNIQIMHIIMDVDPLYAYEEDSSGNFEEIFTQSRDVEKLARKLAKSSVKFLELDYIILELDEETEEKIYQTLSAVECLLVKSRSDPKYMSPTFSEPNFSATLVEKKSWNQKFIKVNDRIIKGDLANDHILFRKLIKIGWISSPYEITYNDLIREHDFEPPKKMKAFSGEVEIDESQPTITAQITMADGSTRV